MNPAPHADVIVIGLGAIGSAVAWQLARRGARVVGIDRFTPPHEHGSSHGASRITRLAIGEGEAYVPLVQRSHQLWRELEAAAGCRLMQRTGGLVIGARDGRARHHGQNNFVQRTLNAARRFGIAHEMLGRDEVLRRFPQFLLRDEEEAYFEPESGLLRPEDCVSAMLQAARNAGALLRFDEPVRSIDSSAGGVSVTTRCGRVHGAKAVLCAGAWTPALLAATSAGAALAPKMKVMRQLMCWFATDEPALYSPECCPIYIWLHGPRAEDLVYGFPQADSRAGIKLGSEQYAASTDPDLVEREVSDAEVREVHARHVAGRLRAVSARRVHAATCLYTVTPDMGFIVDRHPAHEPVTLVSACSGHGFKHSAGLGEALAQGLLGEPVAVDLSVFALNRFNPA